jgi:hypothetical protein
LTLLNESLATALGNGYVFTKLRGKENSGNWYRNRFINLMAKEIYPIVTEYLASGRAMDKTFVDRYIQTYDTRFPEFLVDLEHVLLGRYVLADDTRAFASHSYGTLTTR